MIYSQIPGTILPVNNMLGTVQRNNIERKLLQRNISETKMFFSLFYCSLCFVLIVPPPPASADRTATSANIGKWTADAPDTWDVWFTSGFWNEVRTRRLAFQT